MLKETQTTEPNMGDLYAAQIMTDYELAQKVVDDWWV